MTPQHIEQLPTLPAWMSIVILLIHLVLVVTEKVNSRAVSYHITPFTLMPAVFNLQQNQSFIALWKGVTSTFVVQGIVYGAEAVLGDFLGLPREVNHSAGLYKVARHILLKSVTFLVSTPFASAAFVETVQSDVASERPGIFDCLKEGLGRLPVNIFGLKDSSRKLAIWILVSPSVTYQLSHYLISSVTQYITRSAVKKHMLKRNVEHRTVFDDFFPDLFAAFSAHLIADTVLFPLETVVHRLYLQGTRTIIDNLDSGLSVIPVNSRYEGFADCVRSICRNEGWMGFYKGIILKLPDTFSQVDGHDNPQKGFGALVLQYVVYYAILRITRIIFEQLEDSLRLHQQQHQQIIAEQTQKKPIGPTVPPPPH